MLNTPRFKSSILFGIHSLLDKSLRVLKLIYIYLFIYLLTYLFKLIANE